MLLLQYLILALSLTLIVKITTALKRKPWVWSLLLVALVIVAENVLRGVIPAALATLSGAAMAFVLLYFVKFTPIRF